MTEKTEDEDEDEFDGKALDRITEKLIDAMRQLSSLRVLLIEAHAEAGKARHERWLEHKARP
jgi:hypothetical protein